MNMRDIFTNTAKSKPYEIEVEIDEKKNVFKYRWSTGIMVTDWRTRKLEEIEI